MPRLYHTYELLPNASTCFTMWEDVSGGPRKNRSETRCCREGRHEWPLNVLPLNDPMHHHETGHGERLRGVGKADAKSEAKLQTAFSYKMQVSTFTEVSLYLRGIGPHSQEMLLGDCSPRL